MTTVVGVEKGERRSHDNHYDDGGQAGTFPFFFFSSDGSASNVIFFTFHLFITIIP